MEIRFGETTARGRRIALFWLLVILVVILDQTTKAAAIEVLEHGSLTFIPGILNLVLVYNTGAAFSFGEGAGVIFVLAAIAFFVASFVCVTNTEDLPFRLVVSISLIAGGGMGNLVDRLIAGCVTDFLSFSFIRFPVFNVADICVTLGVAATVLFLWQWDASKQSLSVDADM